MTGQVIDFPRRDGASERKEGVKTQRKEALEAEQRAFARRLRETLASADGKPKFPSKLKNEESALRLARRLGDKLHPFKTGRKGALSEILQSAGIQLPERKRYVIFPGEDVADKRIRKLQPYVRLSDAIASAVGRDANLDLYVNFSGLGLLGEVDDDADEYTTLCALIERMAQAVAAKTDLQGYYDLAGEMPGALAPNGKLVPSRMTVIRERFRDGVIDHWTEPQPIPVFPICRLREQTIDGRVAIGPWIELSEAHVPDLLASASEDRRLAEQACKVEVWREFGLSIAERTQQGDLGPMVTGKAHIRIVVKDDWSADLLHSETLEPLYSEEPFLVTRTRLCGRASSDVEDDGSGYDGLVEIDELAAARVIDLAEHDDLWLLPDINGQPDPHAVEHYYTSNHLLDSRLLEYLLDRARYDVSTRPLVDCSSPDDHSSFHGYSLAQDFENALLSGEIEAVLTATINKLCDQLRAYDNDRREVMRQRRETFLNNLSFNREHSE